MRAAVERSLPSTSHPCRRLGRAAEHQLPLAVPGTDAPFGAVWPLCAVVLCVMFLCASLELVGAGVGRATSCSAVTVPNPAGFACAIGNALGRTDSCLISASGGSRWALNTSRVFCPDSEPQPVAELVRRMRGSERAESFNARGWYERPRVSLNIQAWFFADAPRSGCSTPR